MKLHKRNYTLNMTWLAIQRLQVREHGIAEWARSLARKIPGLVAIKVLHWLEIHPNARNSLHGIFALIGFGAGWDGLLQSIQKIAGTTVVPGRLVDLNYQQWSGEFDSPPSEVLSRMASSESERSTIVLIVFFDKFSESNAGNLALGLISSVGQPWRAIFVFSENCNTKATIKSLVSATNGDSRIGFDAQEIARTEYYILLEGNVILRSHALCVLIDALSDSPKSMIAYADEDTLSSNGIPYEPWFKPRFSRLLSRQGLLLGKLLGIRSSLVDIMSVISSLTESQTAFAEVVNSLALMAGEENVLHVPHVLAHVMGSSTLSFDNTDLEPTVEPDVTIIIPTRDRWDLLGNCLESLWKSEWRNDLLRIVVVDNGSTDSQTLTMLEKLAGEGSIVVLRDANAFNWSRLNNLAVDHTTSDLLIFLNNDTEVLDPLWIRKLASLAVLPEVGAVGCKLLYPDFTVQHGGVILGPRGGAVHAHTNLSADDGGYHDLANQTHEVSAVTGACLAVSRKKFLQVHGFNEDFKVAFNDIEFCARLHKHGYRNIYLADSLLIHHECKTRGHDDTPEKLILQRDEARRAWLLHPNLMHNDPYYSPNLSFWKPYELAFLPRRPKVWRRYENRPIKVMLLCKTHIDGDSLAIVTSMYALALQQQGYEVVMAGPESHEDCAYPGCKTYLAYDHLRAALLAAELSVDIIVALSPPFYSITKWTGVYPIVISIDFGDPPPELFTDATRRRSHLSEKDLSLTIASAVYAVSASIARESRAPVKGIIPVANSHLQQWTKSSLQHRHEFRSRHGWTGKMVVLTAIYSKGEVKYVKGIDRVIQLRYYIQYKHPDVFKRMMFVLYVDGGILDVWRYKYSGLYVLSKHDKIDAYHCFCAADVYLNLSRWEGVDMGLLQAMAVGLPILASDIAAHRELGAEVIQDNQNATDWLVNAMDKPDPHERQPKIRSWRESQELFLAAVKSAIDTRTKAS